MGIALSVIDGPTQEVTMKAIVSVLFVLAIFAGCARHSTEPSASPALKDKASCEAAGGKWKALTRHCDMD
jgi:hypothetical protein